MAVSLRTPNTLSDIDHVNSADQKTVFIHVDLSHAL